MYPENYEKQATSITCRLISTINQGHQAASPLYLGPEIVQIPKLHKIRHHGPRRDFRFDPFSADGPDLDSVGDSLDGVDWSDPQSLLGMMGVMPKMSSAAEVRKEANEASRNIFASYDRLNKIVERHEATIQKRWVKKTRQQRVRILLDAWPNMPVSPCPDFEAFRKESKEQRERGTKFKDSFMWPYINQEDLSQTKLLPLFLNARGRNPPPIFAAVDRDAMHLGLVTKAIVPIFLNEHVMVLHGATEADGYGKLVSWDSHPDAFEWMHTRKQFLPGEGLIILEAQARVLKFLVDCCHSILHDISPDALTSEMYKPQPEPSLKSDSDANGFTSLAVMAAEAPYRPPAHRNLERLSSLLEAKVSAAEDHIWALREDPAYFSRYLLEVKDHRQEMLKDTEGRSHPVTSQLRENTLWARIIGSVLTDSYIGLDYFAELRDQSRRLRVMEEKYSAIISPSNDLPSDYLTALLRFRHFLEQAIKGPLGQLRVAVIASAPMRKFFVREPALDVHSTRISIRSRSGVKMSKTEEQLIWLLRTLWEDEYTLFLARLPNVVDELERLLQADAHARSLISGHVVTILGDLSILAQCTKQLELYQPWAQTFESALVDHLDNFKEEFAKRSSPWAQIMAACREQNLAAAVKLGIPSQGRFKYPFEKRRTKEVVEALRIAESNLDTFWIKIDQLMRDKAPDLGRTALQHLLSEPRMLRRTAEWVEPTPTKNQTQSVVDPQSVVIDQPLSNVFLEYLNYEPQETFDLPTRPRTKVKTRGGASKSENTDILTPKNTPSSVDDQPTFPVDSRALKVFRTIFFNPDVTSTPGSIPWKDFLHAMVSVGFQVEKLYGSVWQFSPTKLDVERGIHFHEPHPEGKIPFEVARRHGRRLNRAYGWFGNMFVLNKE